MNRETLRQDLKAIIEDDLGDAVSAIDDGISLKDDLGLDSVDMVGAIMKVEQRYRIRLTHDELSQVVNVGQLLDLVLARIEKSTVDAAAA